MMRKFIFLFTILLFLNPTIIHATDYIPCEAGKCDGWEITYEKIDNDFRIMVYNNTGKTAFDLTVKIIVYSTDGGMRSVSKKIDIPIRKQVPLTLNIPPKFLKMGAEIYYKDEY
jgi:hypothetical protein